MTVITAEPEGKTHGMTAEGLEEPFIDVDGVPLIAGAIAHIATHVVDRHVAGDHVLFVGEVLAADYVTGDPLIFHSGGYLHGMDRPLERRRRMVVAAG